MGGRARARRWDAAIVGEPTNPEALGDMIKIGRRGSLSGIDHRQRPAGPRRLSASRRQSGARADDAGRCAAGPGLRHGHQGFPADQPRGDLDRCRQSGDQRHPGEGDSHLQHPLQRHLDRRDAAGGNPQPARPRQPAQEIPQRPQRAGRLRARLARPAEPRLPDPRRPADRDAERHRSRRSPAGSRRCPPPAARRTRASSRTIARSSNSGWSARPCTWSTSASRLPTSRR